VPPALSEPFASHHEKRRKIRRAGYKIGFFELTFGDELDILACVRSNRTGGLAGDHTHPEFNIWDERSVLRRAHSESRFRLIAKRQARAAPNKTEDLQGITGETLEPLNDEGSDLCHGLRTC
jgi:hypothetical protein